MEEKEAKATQENGTESGSLSLTACTAGEQPPHASLPREAKGAKTKVTTE